MEKQPIIALLTDFGLKNPYIASMKAVIYSICPNVNIIDISHTVTNWSIIEASYILECSYKYFPKKTIFTVVIDPGVGTTRKPIVIKTKNYVFVGPDNGVLLRTALLDGIREIREIQNKKIMLENISNTFHGRDIFAPVSAYIACGLNLTEIGPEIKQAVNTPISEPIFDDDYIEGIVYFIDDFGNIATNISIRDVEKKRKIRYGDKLFVQIRDQRYSVLFVKSFGHVRKGEILLQENSCGKIEIAVNQGTAFSLLKPKIGEKIKILFL